jgi:hypothetical protein
MIPQYSEDSWFVGYWEQIRSPTPQGLSLPLLASLEGEMVYLKRQLC